jgi:glycosyltransferase involved in cell wall biosynthesis
MLSKAIQQSGVKAMILSFGRGRQDGSGRYFPGKVGRVQGVPVVYLPFLHLPFLSELLSLLSPIPVLWRIRRKQGRKTALFYNRMVLYLAALALARMLRFETALDLEDGEIDASDSSVSSARSRAKSRIFDNLCSGGALLACRALEGATRLRPVECCYGVAEMSLPKANWDRAPYTVLLGGTVSRDTGAPALAHAINILRDERLPWADQLRFEITGKGDCLSLFEDLSKKGGCPKVVVHGRTTDEEYERILSRTQVGLALKPNTGVLAQTTFPSKVVEFASHGILVLTTDISDVRTVLGDGAIYLATDDAQLLVDKLRWIVENPTQAAAVSSLGAREVSARCGPQVVGEMLSSLLFQTA